MTHQPTLWKPDQAETIGQIILALDRCPRMAAADRRKLRDLLVFGVALCTEHPHDTASLAARMLCSPSQAKAAVKLAAGLGLVQISHQVEGLDDDGRPRTVRRLSIDYHGLDGLGRQPGQILATRPNPGHPAKPPGQTCRPNPGPAGHNLAEQTEPPQRLGVAAPPDHDQADRRADCDLVTLKEGISTPPSAPRQSDHLVHSAAGGNPQHITAATLALADRFDELHPAKQKAELAAEIRKAVGKGLHPSIANRAAELVTIGDKDGHHLPRGELDAILNSLARHITADTLVGPPFGYFFRSVKAACQRHRVTWPEPRTPRTV